MRKKIKIIIISFICVGLFVFLGLEIKKRFTETWWDMTYIARVNTSDLTVYTNLDGESMVDKVPSVDDLKGNKLDDSEASRFMELFNGQEMSYYWYGIYTDEREEYNTYKYDMILDMEHRRIMVDTYEDVAYYLDDKEKGGEPCKFELSDEQEAFIDDLIERYGVKEYGRFIKNVAWVVIICVALSVLFIVRKKR